MSDAAKNLRKIVQNAREPDELLFKQLPDALGFPAFDAETATDVKVVSRFFHHTARRTVRIRTGLRSAVKFHRATARESLQFDTQERKTSGQN